MSIRLRLARLEAAAGEPGETLLVITGVPSGEADDGTGPTVARVNSEWISRDPGEPTDAFLARVDALSQRRPA